MTQLLASGASKSVDGLFQRTVHTLGAGCSQLGQPLVARGVQAGALPALLGGGGAPLWRAALEDTLSGERYGFATVEVLAAFLLRLVGEEGAEGSGDRMEERRSGVRGRIADRRSWIEGKSL